MLTNLYVMKSENDLEMPNKIDVDNEIERQEKILKKSYFFTGRGGLYQLWISLFLPSKPEKGG